MYHLKVLQRLARLRVMRGEHGKEEDGTGQTLVIRVLLVPDAGSAQRGNGAVAAGGEHDALVIPGNGIFDEVRHLFALERAHAAGGDGQEVGAEHEDAQDNGEIQQDLLQFTIPKL